MEHTMEKKTDIKDYDDRKISFTESRDGDVLLRNLMLSDLTERERNIYKMERKTHWSGTANGM